MREKADEMATLANLDKVTLVPEYDPVLEQAIGLLKANGYDPLPNHLAVERTLRAVRVDAHQRSLRYWLPVLIAIACTSIFAFSVLEALTGNGRVAMTHSVGYGSYSHAVGADTFSDAPSVKP